MFQDISNNFIRSQGAEAFAEMLETNTTLKTLSLKGEFLSGLHAISSFFVLPVSSMFTYYFVDLFFSGNQLTDLDAKLFGEALRNNMSLSCLDLSHNSFGDIGGMYLGAGLVCFLVCIYWKHKSYIGPTIT